MEGAKSGQFGKVLIFCRKRYAWAPIGMGNTNVKSDFQNSVWNPVNWQSAKMGSAYGWDTRVTSLYSAEKGAKRSRN